MSFEKPLIVQDRFCFVLEQTLYLAPNQFKFARNVERIVADFNGKIGEEDSKQLLF